MNYKWKCPDCGCKTIEEVMNGVTQSSSIDNLYYNKEEDQILAEYGESSTEGGDTDTIRYQCLDCGREIGKEEMISLAAPVEDM